MTKRQKGEIHDEGANVEEQESAKKKERKAFKVQKRCYKIKIKGDENAPEPCQSS